ncbi:hypothetical protein EHN07_18375 [Buttiauxella warmboldiae]|uniref:Uncharacterized protein n=1 Tax=Buttiauxella warmboldiae TaxID=82993 RepID=A0A3N5D9D1_9ENTR|nr:hypothetical protein [Buttiauxella warmboldiae]RPH21474.1 hypothetical protein EHN07_18375 [Buttiauxella warmboldiae]
MKTIKYTTVAVALSVLSFGALAAAPATPTATQAEPSAVWQVSDIEAGSNIQPGAQSTGQSMDDAFNVYTLVAGEWS